MMATAPATADQSASVSASAAPERADRQTAAIGASSSRPSAI
jgi:hypothetical protein